MTIEMQCGAFRMGLSSASASPVPTASISRRIDIIASQNLSNSRLDSLSVGSTMIVPGTGKWTVGAWKP